MIIRWPFRALLPIALLLAAPIYARTKGVWKIVSVQISKFKD